MAFCKTPFELRDDIGAIKLLDFRKIVFNILAAMVNSYQADEVSDFRNKQ